MKKNIKILLLVVFLLAVGGFIFYQKSKSKTVAPTYQTAVAEKGTLITTVTASGQVATTNSRTVTTTASGVVKKVYVTEGQKVKTGTPLMLIDLDMDGLQKLKSAYSAYLSAQNNLKSAQDKILTLDSALVNAKNIFDNQWKNQSPDDPTYKQRYNDYVYAQASYDNQAKAIDQAQSSLESARLSYQLASATVYAPISGTVSAISLTKGMILNPTSTSSNSTNTANKIAIVKTDTTPAVTVNLTEIDVPKVKVGNKVTLTLDAFSGKTFTGKIIAIDTAGTVSSNVVSYPTTIQFDSDVPGVLSNMSATANIITDVKDDVILIPFAAIQNSTVKILKNGQITTVEVTTGSTDNTNTEITSGINVGDTVVTNVSSTTTTKNSSSTSVFGNTRGSMFGGGGR